MYKHRRPFCKLSITRLQGKPHFFFLIIFCNHAALMGGPGHTTQADSYKIVFRSCYGKNMHFIFSARHVSQQTARSAYRVFCNKSTASILYLFLAPVVHSEEPARGVQIYTQYLCGPNALFQMHIADSHYRAPLGSEQALSNHCECSHRKHLQHAHYTDNTVSTILGPSALLYQSADPTDRFPT